MNLSECNAFLMMDTQLCLCLYLVISRDSRQKYFCHRSFSICNVVSRVTCLCWLHVFSTPRCYGLRWRRHSERENWDNKAYPQNKEAKKKGPFCCWLSCIYLSGESSQRLLMPCSHMRLHSVVSCCLCCIHRKLGTNPTVRKQWNRELLSNSEWFSAWILQFNNMMHTLLKLPRTQATQQSIPGRKRECCHGNAQGSGQPKP